MKQRDPRLCLKEMLDAIERIERYIAGWSLSQFLDDPLRQDAITRRLEVLGDACRQLPAELLSAWPEVRWEEIRGMRNRLAHEYDDIDMPTVWDAATSDLPVLKIVIKAMLTQLG